MKRITISINDWIFEKYLNANFVNKSAFIEEMIVKGIETTKDEEISGKDSPTAVRFVQILTENRALKEQINTIQKKLLKKEEHILDLEKKLKKAKDKNDMDNWKTIKIGE